MFDRATDVLMMACARRFGFTYYPAPDRLDVVIAADKADLQRAYGITDPDVASKYGYLPTPIPPPPAPKATISAAFDLVVEGQAHGTMQVITADAKSPGLYAGQQIPLGGCRGEARIKLFGSPSNITPFRTGKVLSLQAVGAAGADRRVQRIVGEWSRCMAGKGYSGLKDPLSVEPPKVATRAEGAPAPTAEVHMALTDIACKKSVNLVDRWNSVDVEYQQRAPEKHQLQLQEERAGIQAALRKAVAVVNGG